MSLRWSLCRSHFINTHSCFLLNPFVTISFSSWAGLAVAVYIFCTWLFHHCFAQRNLSVGTPSNKWYLLLAAAVIVTASASRLLTPNCEDSDTSLCRRTKYGITAGAVGTFFALVISIMSFTNHLSMWPEIISAVVVFVIFVIGIAFLTFGGADAPASNVGNLYFSVWICFILGMFLMNKCFKEFKKSREGGDDEEEVGEEDEEAAEKADEEEAPEATPEQAAGAEASGTGD